METALLLLALAAGFACLLIGAHALVRSASALASRIGVSPLWIGLTVVAFGTSMPELVVSANASATGHGAVALGNVIGSNIMNILVVLGVTAAVAPIPVKRQTVRQDIPLVQVAGIAVILAAWDGDIGRFEGSVLLLAALAYTWHLYRRERGAHVRDADIPDPWKETPAVLVLAVLVGSIVLLWLGGNLTLTGAIGLAEEAGVSERTIALTVVAIGTSLPELAVSITATLKRAPDVAVGNLVGSNLLNLLMVLGGAALVAPFSVPANMVRIDLFVMLGVSLLLWRFAATRLHVSRPEGIVLVAVYLVYISLLLA